MNMIPWNDLAEISENSTLQYQYEIIPNNKTAEQNPRILFEYIVSYMGAH